MMQRQRGFSLVEATVLLGIVAASVTVAVLSFSYAIHSAQTATARDQAQLDAYNVATSLRAAMRYDRGAVAAIGAAPASAWTLGSASYAATPTNGNLTVNANDPDATASAAIVIPIAQEVPAPNTKVLVP